MSGYLGSEPTLSRPPPIVPRSKYSSHVLPHSSQVDVIAKPVFREEGSFEALGAS